MIREDWLKEFPARVVGAGELEGILHSADNQWSCEKFKDHREEECNHGGMEVVQHADTFYVIWRD